MEHNVLTQKLAVFVSKTRFEDLPSAAADRAKRHILDTIGVILAGTSHPAGQIITDYVRQMGASSISTVMGAGFQTSPSNAALANGTMGHVHDFDDDSDTVFSHPSITLVPALLALGESVASGKTVIAAYVLGHEVAARIASVPGFLPDHYRRGWHATSTLGVLGAAAAASKILNLDTEKTCNALGIAAADAGGLQGSFGTMAKSFQAGSASGKAVRAALLARSGFTGNNAIIESRHGFLELFGQLEKPDVKKIIKDLGESFDIIAPGINIKKYPSCYYTHAAVENTLDLLNAHGIAIEEIEHICCGVSDNAFRVLSHTLPEKGLEGKFSLPYCIAVGIIKKALNIEDFEDHILERGDVQALMKKVNVSVDSEISAISPGLGASVSVETRKDGIFTKKRGRPPGGCDEPLSSDAVVDKFRKCASRVLMADDIRFVEDSIEGLDCLSDLSELMHILRQAPGKRRAAPAE